MAIPPWIDERFVEKILQDARKDNSIHVVGFNAEPAVAKGANYMSAMHRLFIEFFRIYDGHTITETISVIVKLELQDGVVKSMVREMGIFEREMLMMMEILPRMNELVDELGVTLSARCLQVQKEDPMYLIIEDLAPRGFQMAQHEAGLNLDHSLLAMRNIAVFHGASVFFLEKEPEMKNIYKNDKSADSPFGELINKSTKALARKVAEWSELSSRISEKIPKLAEVTWKKTYEASLVLDDDFNVLIHGDCSLKNMLFRYNDERKPIEQIFVDFQASRYGSPILDILHFIGSSLSVDVRLENRELLIREYHESLISTMAKIKCKTEAPSLNSLHDALRRRAFFEFYPSVLTLAHTFVNTENAKSADQAVKEMDGEGLPGQENENYRRIMTRVLPFFDSMGLLDV